MDYYKKEYLFIFSLIKDNYLQWHRQAKDIVKLSGVGMVRREEISAHQNKRFGHNHQH